MWGGDLFISTMLFGINLEAQVTSRRRPSPGAEWLPRPSFSGRTQGGWPRRANVQAWAHFPRDPRALLPLQKVTPCRAAEVS